MDGVVTPSITGQSFTMSGCQSGGYLESIDVLMTDLVGASSTVNDVTLEIFDGNGFSGNLLYTQTGITLSTPGWSNWNNIQLAGGVGTLAYTDGNQYTFKLSASQGIRLLATGSNPYAGGNRHEGGGSAATDDLAFKVNVTNSNTLVPTSAIGTETGCVGSTVDVPVNITNGDNIGALSYKVTFDTSKVTFVQITNTHAHLATNFNYTNATTANGIGEIVISWYDGSSPGGQNFGTSPLFDLEFIGKAVGASAIDWQTTTPYGEVSSGSGSPISGAVFTNGSVTISNGATAGLSSSDADNTICVGEAVTFTATGGATYDFKINGTSVQSGASDTYATSSLADGDVVTVLVTNIDGCTDESTGITTSVNPLPTVTLTNDATNNEICAGDNITFTAGGGDVGAMYEFFVNNSSVQNSVSTTYSSTTLNDQDQVSVTVTNTTGCTGSYTNTAAYVNNAMTFDGVDDHVNAGNTLGNFGTGDFTVELWTKTTGSANGSSLVSKRATCGCENFWNINLAETGNVTVEIYTGCSGGSYNFSSTDTITDGNWHHIALTRSGNFHVLYIDGVVAFSTIFTAVDLNNTNDFRIGMNACSPFSWLDYFPGDIDEVRVWSVARSMADLNTYKNTELTGTETGLTAYYDFNQVSGAVIDKTGTYNATLGGNAATFPAATNGMTGTGVISTTQTITVNPLPTPTLTSSDADNILCNGESVTFTGSGGATYAFYVNGTVVQAESVDSTFDTSTLNDQDVVTVEVFNASGCSATSSGITVTVGSNVTAFTVGGGGAYCPSSGAIGVTLSNTEIGVNYILVENGTTNIDTLSGTGAGLTFNNGTAIAGASSIYTIVAYNVATPACVLAMTGSATVTLSCYNINVTLNYDNGLGQPLKNTPVNLFNSSNQQIGTQTSDNNGQVTFSNIADGTGYYILADLSAKQFGGINSTDAFFIAQDFINPSLLQGLKDRAGDVDGNGANNANDALQVANRFVFNPYTYVQDWLHDNDTTNAFAVSGADVSMTSLVLTFGDVNGSYNVSNLNNGNTSNFHLFNEGEILVTENAAIEIPFYAMERIEAGAISLVISYPYDVFDVENVILGKDIAAQNLQYKITEDGKIRLSWFSLQPIELNRQEALIKIIAKVHSDLTDAYQWTPTITLGNESELADGNGQVISTVNLALPTIVLPQQSVLEGASIFQQLVYPNPVIGEANLEYHLPSDADVQITLFDITGKQIQILVNETQSAGIYQMKWDVSQLAKGVYTIKTAVTMNGEASFYVEQLVVK